MPIIDLEPSLVDAPVDTPTGFRTTAEYIEPGGGRKFVASIEPGGSGIPVGAEHDFLVGVTSRVTGKSPSDIANRWGVLATDPELVAMSKLRGTPTFSEGAAAIFRHENSLVSQMSAADRVFPLEREEARHRDDAGLHKSELHAGQQRRIGQLDSGYVADRGFGSEPCQHSGSRYADRRDRAIAWLCDISGR
jgi:hypothetical protein